MRKANWQQRSLEMTRQMQALQRGAHGIKKLAEAAAKRTNIAEEILSVGRQQSMISLFSMPGTDKFLQERFIRLSQVKALSCFEEELKNLNTAEEQSGESTESVNSQIREGVSIKMDVEDGITHIAGSISSSLNN